MYPTLFRLGSLAVNAYSFMLGLSFILGLCLALWQARKAGLSQHLVVDASFWIVLLALVGARIAFVLLYLDDFKKYPLSIFLPLSSSSDYRGGSVMVGGLMGGIFAVWAFFRLKKKSFLPYADVFSPALGLGIFLTRIGCFLNGCCYGKPTDAWFGVHFPPNCPAGQYQLSVQASKLIPSQLLLSAGGLLILIIILASRGKKIFEGFHFFLTIAFYSVWRFLVDLTRFYPLQEKLGPLSYNQIVCIIFLLIVSRAVWIRAQKR